MAKQIEELQKNFLIDCILDARNSRRENILHFTCRLNKFHVISNLISISADFICEQDFKGRTALHMAIENNQQECVMEFRKLIKSHESLPMNIQQSLRQMFKVYSNRGHTVLHAAVVANSTDLLRDMLKYCKAITLNVADFETLGPGDSILHLAVTHNYLEAAKIIKSEIPKSVKFENYSGQTALEITEITSEMSNLLRLDLQEQE